MPYEKPEDFAVLKEYYTDYCTKRFSKIKHLFCDALGITYEEVEEVQEEVSTVVSPKVKPVESKKVKFADKCAVRLAQEVGNELIKMGRSSYMTADGKRGFVLTTSKAYKQGNRDKYWFAYRKNPLEDLKKCEEVYVVYGCKDESTMVSLPVSLIEEHIDALNISKDDDGKITHWHMVFFKDVSRNMTWLLSKPHLQEISIDKYIM